MMPPPWELRTISSCSFVKTTVFSRIGVASLALFSMARGAGAALIAGVVEMEPRGVSSVEVVSIEGVGLVYT